MWCGVGECGETGAFPEASSFWRRDPGRCVLVSDRYRDGEEIDEEKLPCSLCAMRPDIVDLLNAEYFQEINRWAEWDAKHEYLDRMADGQIPGQDEFSDEEE